MRKILCLLCSYVILASSIYLQNVHVNAAENSKKEEKVFIVDSNSNMDTCPSVLIENEMQFIGPKAFYLSNNTVFLDDTFNQRILIYENGSFLKSIQLQWYMDVQLMYFDENSQNIKVVYQDLSDTSYSHIYMALFSKETGVLLEATDLCENGRILLEYAFDTEGNLLTQYLPLDGEIAALSVEENPLMYQPELVEETEKNNYIGASDFTVGVNPESIYSVHSAYFEGDEEGEISGTIYVAKSNDDDMTSYMELIPSAGGVNRGNIQVTSEGKIYQLVVDEDNVIIYELIENERVNLSKFQQENMHTVYSMHKQNTYTMYAGTSLPKAMSKETVRERMETYRNLSWTFNSSKNSNLSVTGNPSKVTQPKWLTELADGKDHRVVGVPYCWGGWNAESFVSNINDGKFAGNVYTDRSSGYVSGTVGMDCAGYVSVVFDLPYRHGTASLKGDYFEEQNSDTVQAYDILNKANSHVVIVLIPYTIGGKEYVNIYEESSEAGKTRIQTGVDYYGTYINNGYVVLRYKNLQ